MYKLFLFCRLALELRVIQFFWIMIFGTETNIYRSPFVRWVLHFKPIIITLIIFVQNSNWKSITWLWWIIRPISSERYPIFGWTKTNVSIFSIKVLKWKIEFVKKGSNFNMILCIFIAPYQFRMVSAPFYVQCFVRKFWNW